MSLSELGLPYCDMLSWHTPRGEQIPSGVYYFPRSPLVVEIELLAEGQDPSTWLIDRNIIRDAYRQPSGMGEIQARVDLLVNRFRLGLLDHVTGARMWLSCSAREMWEILASSYKMVPRCRCPVRGCRECALVEMGADLLIADLSPQGGSA